MSHTALKLAGSTEQRAGKRFDRFAWERWFQDEGAMRDLSCTELAVLMIMLRAANERGESWWGRTKIADRCGCTPQSVTRARAKLVKRGLIVLVSSGGVNGARRTSRYRIPMCWPSRSANQLALSPPARLDAVPGPDTAPGKPTPDLDAVSGEIGSWPEAALACVNGQKASPMDTPNGGSPRHPPLAHTPPDGGAPRPPKSPAKNPASSKADGNTVGVGDPSPSGSDEAVHAAAALLIDFGMAPQAALELVRVHAPTYDEVCIAIANAKAWQQAHREGRRKALNNPVGFLRSEIAKKNYTLDSEAKKQQESKRFTAERNAKQRHNEQLDQAFAGLSTEQRERYKPMVLAEMRAQNTRMADYYKKFRPQDEPLRKLIARVALAESEAGTQRLRE